MMTSLVTSKLSRMDAVGLVVDPPPSVVKR